MFDQFEVKLGTKTQHDNQNVTSKGVNGFWPQTW